MSIFKDLERNGGRVITSISEIDYINNHKFGKYAPSTGYYKLTEVLSVPIQVDRKIEIPIYARFNGKEATNFSNEVFLFEGRFLYNKMAVGNRSVPLKAEMIIHIKDVALVDAYYKGEKYQTYKIVWEILNNMHTASKPIYHSARAGLDNAYSSDNDGYQDNSVKEGFKWIAIAAAILLFLAFIGC